MKKKCSKCGEWLDRATNFYTAGKNKDGSPKYASKCKGCSRDVQRERYHEGKYKNWTHKQAYIRARSRALTRLSKLVPELYEMCLREELEKEGVNVPA